MDIALFDYDLPRRLIAQYPTKRRGESRLLVLNRADSSCEHKSFCNFAEYLRPCDGLVVNDTKVFKARLWGRRRSGARVEVFLVRPAAGEARECWEALVSPSRRLKAGEEVVFDESGSVHLLEQFGDGRWLVCFGSAALRERIIRGFGHVPLPPYVAREDAPSDVRRYQTIFAGRDKVGAVAAPTAGFHFGRPLLKSLVDLGIEVIRVTLHVGPGTFKPVKADQIENHVVDPEYAELSPEAASRINAVRARGGALFVVGTTSVRTLESAPTNNGRIQPFSGMVDLYIRQGFAFRWTDHLLTNFHLPKSSLLILVSALAGRERVLEAYQQAIAREYRFYSYGDAMLVL